MPHAKGAKDTARLSRNQIQTSVCLCTTIRRSFVFPIRFSGPHTATLFSLVNNLCGLRVLCVRPLRASGAARADERTIMPHAKGARGAKAERMEARGLFQCTRPHQSELRRILTA